jgi:hypothetical protein
LGDDNTKFFHDNATIKHNNNLIMVLKNANGEEKTKHEDNDNILYEAFKEWLGTKQCRQMHFDLNELIKEGIDMEVLQEHFAREEIDNIVKNLPSGKSSGPDGFNSHFLKKRWGVIAQDFYDMCSGFYDNNICLQSINGSYIVLVPKVDNPSLVNEF